MAGVRRERGRPVRHTTRPWRDGSGTATSPPSVTASASTRSWASTSRCARPAAARSRASARSTTRSRRRSTCARRTAPSTASAAARAATRSPSCRRSRSSASPRRSSGSPTGSGVQLTYEGGGSCVQRDRGTRTRLLEANKLAAEFYAAQLRTPEARARELPHRARVRRGRGRALRLRLRPGRLGRADQAPARPRLHARRADQGRALPAGQPRPDRPLPPPAAVADPRPRRRRRRLRRPAAVRRRPHRGQVPQHPRDAGLPQVPGAVRARPGQAGDRQAPPGGGRRGLHRRDGHAPRRRPDRGRDLRDRVRRRARRACSAGCIGDDSFDRGEVIYIFDGDAAGQAAAIKAFEGDQSFAAQTYVAIGRDGMDPCELRQASGDTAVRDLVARRQPLFAFAMRSILREHDLNTAEGRVAALQRTVPLVARIRGEDLRDEYARRLAGLDGLGRRSPWSCAGCGRRPARPSTPRPAPRRPRRARRRARGRPAPARPARGDQGRAADPRAGRARSTTSCPTQAFSHPGYARGPPGGARRRRARRPGSPAQPG